MSSRLSRRLLTYTASVVLLLILMYFVIPIFNGNATISREEIFSQNKFSEASIIKLGNVGDGRLESNSETSATESLKYSISLDPNITKRGEWQTKQIDNYCQKHKIAHFRQLYSFLLYDDHKKIVFCYVPKVGCSKWKYTFLLLSGVVSFDDEPSRKVLHKVKKLSSLSETERQKRLTTYFKYIFIRNPMERLVSAYLDKIANPLNKSTIKYKNEEKFKARIIKKWRPGDYSAWLKDSRAIYPTFSEYIDYINIIKLRRVDKHFKPIAYLCLPCKIKYNFYANFKLLPDDAKAVLDHFDLNSSYYDYTSFISHKSYKTSDLVIKYFSQLTTAQKEKLFHKYTDELDFYYSLYPEEKDGHLNLL